METRAHDVRSAVRALTGLRGVGLVAIATLALGINAEIAELPEKSVYVFFLRVQRVLRRSSSYNDRR